MSMYQIQLILPDEVVEGLPADSRQWVPYLKNFFEGSVLRSYEESIMNRQKGSILGQSLSRYERSMLLDFMIDIALGQLRDSIELKNQAHASEYAIDRIA